MRGRATSLVTMVAAVVLAGCGGGDGDSGGAAEHTSTAKSAESDAARVIREWSDTLRRGDVQGAAKFFALPSVVSNGTPPITLHSLRDARLFNAGLPCGAKLLRTSRSGKYTTATFRLTERPGRGRCGSGTGLHARTAFAISGGKIREWRRLPNEPSPSAPSGPVIQSDQPYTPGSDTTS
jgi:hypothetical protein